MRRSIARVANLETPFGKLIQTIEMPKTEGKGIFKLPIQHPLAFLYIAARESPSFLGLLDRMREDLLGVILYSDEVTPGNIQGHIARKFYAVYWSLKNLGVGKLSQDRAWWTLALVRSDEVADLEGGLPALYRKLLQAFFGTPGPACHDLRSGVWMDRGAGRDGHPRS